jgi:peptide deformylase
VTVDLRVSAPAPCGTGAGPLNPVVMKLPILIHPDPRLKKVADPVPDLSDDLRKLADDMLETMYDAPGIGLAAPQIGMSQRLIVLDCVKEEGAAPRPIAMFNPEIVASSDETSVYEEGCLSIPETFADVTRPAEVTVRWMDRTATPRRKPSTGSGRPACSTRSTTSTASFSSTT